MSDANDSAYSVREYLKLVFLDPVTVLGVVIVAVGLALVAVSSPESNAPVDAPLLGGGLMLVGTVVFALGYTRAQWALRRRRR